VPFPAASIGGIRVEIFQTCAEIEEAGQVRTRIRAARGEKRAEKRAIEERIFEGAEKTNQRQGERQAVGVESSRSKSSRRKSNSR